MSKLRIADCELRIANEFGLKFAIRNPKFAFHSASFILSLTGSIFSSRELTRSAFSSTVSRTKCNFHRVSYKMKRRRVPQVQRKSELLADIRRRVLQSAQGRQVFLLVALNRDINAGVTEVVSHAHFRHRD